MPEPEIDGAVEPAAEVLAGSQSETAADAPSVPAVADEVLLNAASVARTALLEITAAPTIGEVAGHIVEGEHVLSLLFENTLPGYPGWFWTVSLSREEGSDEVNVLETELMPGDGALLAPDWVPWSQRMAEYQAQQKALREAAAAAGEELPEDEFVLGDADAEHDDDFDDEHYADDELEERELEEDELLDELAEDEGDFDDESDDDGELDDDEPDGDGELDDDEPDGDDEPGDDEPDDDFDASDDIQGAEAAALEADHDDEA